jgi:sulfoxide reductase catalytic subunit YedY
MLIKIKNSSSLRDCDVTDEAVYSERRQFINNSAKYTAAGILASYGVLPIISSTPSHASIDFSSIKRSDYRINDNLTSLNSVTSYNNYYELGSGKKDPKLNAHLLKTQPWSITVEGYCNKPGNYVLEDFISSKVLEERIYRQRCVEAWSMVIPWVGIEVGKILKKFEPNSKAKFVEFESIYEPEHLPGQQRAVLSWPYTEGLRIDEAMHPLAIFAVGLYGKELLNQNGAPLRLVVPWKYGFKSIKSIVRIRFIETQAKSAWNLSAPSEYGFYSNVNPDVDHPRWSQKKERRIGDFLKRKTMPFNGYADQVADLYQGMDLKKYF